MYKVLKAFTDLQDGKYIYHVGDVYPREGKTADKERCAELSGGDNLCGVQLIEYVAEASGSPSESLSDDEASKSMGADTKSKRKPSRKRKEN